MLGRMQIEGDEVGGLLLEIRIVRSHVTVEPLRLEAVLAPDSGNHHVRDPESLGELARAPVGGGCGLALDCPLKDARFQFGGQSTGLLARVAAKQSRQTFLGKALAPAIDKRIVAGELVADLGPGVTRLEQQDQPCTTRVVRSPRLAARSLTQFYALYLRKFDCAHRHNHTTFSVVTGH